MTQTEFPHWAELRHATHLEFTQTFEPQSLSVAQVDPSVLYTHRFALQTALVEQSVSTVQDDAQDVELLQVYPVMLQ